MVKVINIDNLGRVNLSRRAVFEKVSQISRARVEDSRSASYPFKRSGGGSSSGHPSRGRPRYSGGERPYRTGGSSPRPTVKHD